MNHPTNWLMRILLLALVGLVLFLVPVALGAEVVGDPAVRVDGEVHVDPEQIDPTSVEGTASAVSVEAEAEAEGLPVPPGEVAVSSEDVTAAVSEGSVSAETASEGIATVTNPLGKTEVQAASAVVVAATGAGAVFWLKNAIGLALGRFLGAPLFSRLSKDELLENDGRETLFNLVNANPGINLAELAGQSGLGWGTTVYHLGRLEQAGFITSMKNGQARHFFKNGHPAAKSKMAVAVLKNETAAQLGRYLLATPGATGKTIAKGLGIAPPTVTKYVQRLEAEGLVETLKEGRSKIVQPTALLAEAMQHVDAPMPSLTATEPVQHGVSAYA